MHATVRAIFIRPKRGAGSVPLDSVEAVTGGLDGDHHAGASRRRQILLMSGATLDELHLQAGTVYENVVIDGLDVMTLKPGQELRLGDALVAVTIACDPCVQMDRIRYGLQDALKNRRGMFVKVVVPGRVRVGDRLDFTPKGVQGI